MKTSLARLTAITIVGLQVLIFAAIYLEADYLLKLYGEFQDVQSRLQSSLPPAHPSKPHEAVTADPNVARTVQADKNSFDTYTVDLEKTQLEFYWKNDKGEPIERFSALRDYLAKSHRQLVFATNAGIFSPDHAPLGLYIQQGKELVPLNEKRGEGNFYMRPNGIFMVTDRGAFVIQGQFLDSLRPFVAIQSATQSGPLLVMDGAMNSAFDRASKSRNIRSGIGLIAPYQVVFAISKSPVTFYEFAELFRDSLHCQDALYLDGAISQMYLPALKRYDLEGEFAGLIAVSQPEK